MSSRRPPPSGNQIDNTNNAVDASRQELRHICLDIHAHPELNYQEHHAAQLLSDTLERHGFAVERGIGGVETAFRAEIQGRSGDGPTIAILAEYDALPDVGHGCSHNLIATTAVGAGLGIQANLEVLPGRVVVLGTPAEEGGGGKIRLLEAGVFNDVDVVLSSHPSSNRTFIPTDIPLAESWSLAMVGYRYAYHGKAAHAAAAPEAGVNALNAVIHLFTGIDALRQHLREDVRIHGIISDGGKAPNVVPDFAAANFMLRCRDRQYLSEVVVDKVRQVAEGAARITGARLEVSPLYPFYENVLPNGVLASAIRDNAGKVNLRIDELVSGRRGSGASTDFGNVSQVIPAFEMRYAVSDEPVASHSTEMCTVAASEAAFAQAITVAKVLALTAGDLLTNRVLLEKAQADFAQRVG